LDKEFSCKDKVYYSFEHAAEKLKMQVNTLYMYLINIGWLEAIDESSFSFKVTDLAAEEGYIHILVNPICNMGNGEFCFTKKGISKLGLA
jgi:hypothetical protein